jgi:hypothetical protein
MTWRLEGVRKIQMDETQFALRTCSSKAVLHGGRFLPSIPLTSRIDFVFFLGSYLEAKS